jgi:hypothetical protein
MKILHVGPTMPDAQQRAGDIVVRRPAVQGDIFQAVEDGATVIGIVDGGFEYTAPIWHKEILYALSAGVTVLGAASMGALRAAECHAFGMIGVGKIFRQYATGIRVDDADVAQLHGPAELGWMALSEPLVNVSATIDGLAEHNVVTHEEALQLNAIARSIFFKDRTWQSIIALAGFIDAGRAPAFAQGLRAFSINQKRADALDLLTVMAHHSGVRAAAGNGWRFQRTTLWNEMVKQHFTVKVSGELS